MTESTPETMASGPTRPDPALIINAVDLYLREAYGDSLPLTVRSQLATLKSWKGEFFRSPVIIANNEKPPTRYTIRLGNRHYPHMKLAVELSPDKKSFLFKADTHDRHCCPLPGTPEHEPFVKLMEQNQHIAAQIEAAWEKVNIPTFKTYLREDLARRGITA